MQRVLVLVFIGFGCQMLIVSDSGTRCIPIVYLYSILNNLGSSLTSIGKVIEPIIVYVGIQWRWRLTFFKFLEQYIRFEYSFCKSAHTLILPFSFFRFLVRNGYALAD